MSIGDFEPSLPVTSDNKLDLVTYLSSEFGAARSVARIQVAIAEITIGGERYSGDPFFIPMGEAKGKDVQIIGPSRHWRFKIG